jgi:uncharacterized protein
MRARILPGCARTCEDTMENDIDMLPIEIRRSLSQLATSLSLAPQSRSPIHGTEHWRRVMENGAAIAAETPGCDLAVVLLFGLLHDSQRYSDDADYRHGVRAANRVDGMRPMYFPWLDDAQVETLKAALAGHAEGETSDDPTIGACWDADRLDLQRDGVGLTVDAMYMSTDSGKRKAFVLAEA